MPTSSNRKKRRVTVDDIEYYDLDDAVDLVAQALRKWETLRYGDITEKWEDVPSWLKSTTRDQAKAAITALRERGDRSCH